MDMMAEKVKIFPGYPYAELYNDKVHKMSHEQILEYNVPNINVLEGIILKGDIDYPGPKTNYLCESVVNYFLALFESRAGFNRGAYELSEKYKYRLYGFGYGVDMTPIFYDDCIQFLTHRYHSYKQNYDTHMLEKHPFVFYIKPSGEICFTREKEKTEEK